MFEPFFTTSRSGPGTGLGLSQIFGFARQSGGEIGIESSSARGPRSRSICRAHRRRREAAGPCQAANAAPDPALTYPAAAILVVEDDPRVSRSTVAALEELGYRPHACASGREALDLLARDPDIELVVTDVMMPEMTGTELAAEVTRLYPDMAVLFVTGYVGEAGDAGDLADRALLRKPFTVAAPCRRATARCSARSADRPPPQQTRQQSKRAQYRPAPLPRPDLDPRAGVPVDLPRQIIDPARIGRRRLGEPDEGQQFAHPPPLRPQLPLPSARHRGRQAPPFLSSGATPTAASARAREAAPGSRSTIDVDLSRLSARNSAA